jgi:hypothetical protein
MRLECSSNLTSLLCGAAFRTCVEVFDANGDSAWVPSLTCERDCEVISSVWNECVANINSDPDVKRNFENVMQTLGTKLHAFLGLFAELGFIDRAPAIPVGGFNALHPFRCDVSGGNIDDIQDEDWVRAVLLGRWPSTSHTSGLPVWSNQFPAGMATDRLYPVSSSVYTLPDGRGEVDVACSSLASTMAKKARVCPDPWLQPTIDSKNSPKTCVLPCPLPAFSDGEYDLMWIFESRFAFHSF